MKGEGMGKRMEGERQSGEKRVGGGGGEQVRVERVVGIKSGM